MTVKIFVQKKENQLCKRNTNVGLTTLDNGQDEI